MFKVYNKSALTRKQRFQNALLYGIPTALVLGVVYGTVVYFIHIEFSIFFVGIGYLIGYVIQNFGRGVQIQFSILGAVLAVVSFLLGDLISFFGPEVLLHPAVWPYGLWLVVNSWFDLSLNGLLGLAFRAYGIYAAYRYSRVV